MARIFYIMGKSSTGKDSIYRHLLERKELNLKRVIGYTTRPIRKGEKEGEDYFFCSEEQLQNLSRQGKVIETRSYPTIHGDWYYFTVDDGQVDFSGPDMLMIGTLESFVSLQKYYNTESIIPIYIVVEDGLRLQRALDRERSQTRPRYEELCRRFLADSADFSDEKLAVAGIDTAFENEDINDTLDKIAAYIKSERAHSWI